MGKYQRNFLKNMCKGDRYGTEKSAENGYFLTVLGKLRGFFLIITRSCHFVVDYVLGTTQFFKVVIVNFYCRNIMIMSH